VFSISDFDETLHGPFEWDVKRLAASFAVAGREFRYDEDVRRAMVMDAVREYRQAMASFATMRNVDVWYTRLDVTGSIAGFGSGSLPEEGAAASEQDRADAHEGRHASARQAVHLGGR
jgi:hypothetical protein